MKLKILLTVKKSLRKELIMINYIESIIQEHGINEVYGIINIYKINIETNEKI